MSELIRRLMVSMHVPAGDAGGWCSYMPSLCRALAWSGRADTECADFVRVLELGCGAVSSPFLASLAPHVHTIAIESDAKYLPPESTDYHPSLGVPDAGMLEQIPFDVVFVDHTLEGRARDLVHLARNKNVGLIVIHDWNVPVYGYDKLRGLFKHRIEDRSYFPNTAILSNTIDLTSWAGYEGGW